jgi:hypothetical protein
MFTIISILLVKQINNLVKLIIGYYQYLVISFCQSMCFLLI